MKRSKTITENLFHNLQNQTVILSFHDNLLGVAIRNFIDGVDLTLALKCHYSVRTKELTLDLKLPNSYAIATIRESNEKVVFNIAEPRGFYSLAEFVNMKGITHFKDGRFLLVNNKFEQIDCESSEIYKYSDKKVCDHDIIERIQEELIRLFYRQKELKEKYYQTLYQPLFYTFLLKEGIYLLPNTHYMGLTNIALEFNKKEHENTHIFKEPRQADGGVVKSAPIINPQNMLNRYFNDRMVMEYYPTFIEFKPRIFKMRCSAYQKVFDLEVVLFDNGVFHFAERNNEWLFKDDFELEKGEILSNYVNVDSSQSIRVYEYVCTRKSLEEYPFMLTDINEAQRFIEMLERKILDKLSKLLEEDMSDKKGADKDKETLLITYNEFKQYLALKQDFI